MKLTKSRPSGKQGLPRYRFSQGIRRATFLALLTLITCSANTSATYAEEEPIILAIIDDAFLLEDSIFDGMRWRNHAETPHNGIDDDSNGYIDDLRGWDASDLDADVGPPAARKKDFSHGEQIATVIARVVRRHYGEQENYPIKLMPIKAISDVAPELNLQDGYLGLKYAVDNSADVVNMSWSGGVLDLTAKKLLTEARQKDIQIAASVGTYPQRDVSMPAGNAAVFGVAGLDGEDVVYASNYGEEVDIAYDARASSEKSSDDGVSLAVAVVSATMALMKEANRAASAREIKYCIQKTATSVDHANPNIAGQLGSGRLHIDAAIECIQNIEEELVGKESLQENREQAKGVLKHKHIGNSKPSIRRWNIKPLGRYEGLILRPFVEGNAQDSTLLLEPLNRNEKDSPKVIWQGQLSELPSEIASEHAEISVTLTSSSTENFAFESQFATRNIVFSEQFCRGTQEITLSQESPSFELNDGSGTNDYAAHSDCKWLLIPPIGYNLKLKFEQLDTEANTDVIHLFRGSETAQSNLLMKITGDKPPPPIVVEKFPVLIWFVADDQTQGEGFKVLVSITPNN